MKVGAPMLKLKPGGQKSKRSGDMKHVLGEAYPVDKDGKRWSADADPARAGLNTYGGYNNAFTLYDAIEERVEAYNATLKEQGKRGLRSDAVHAVNTIIKPPAEEFMTWSKDRREAFLRDSLGIMTDIIGKDRVMAYAIHRDEDGDHIHFTWMPWTDDGRLSAKEVCNLKLFNRANREYPQRMRALGWEVEDLVSYDEDAVKQMTPEDAAEYKAKHIAEKKQRKHGQSRAEYHREQEEKKAAEARAEYDRLTAQNAAERTKLAEAIDRRIKADEAADKAQRAADEAEARAAAAESRISETFEQFERKVKRVLSDAKVGVEYDMPAPAAPPLDLDDRAVLAMSRRFTSKETGETTYAKYLKYYKANAGKKFPPIPEDTRRVAARRQSTAQERLEQLEAELPDFSGHGQQQSDGYGRG